MTTLKEDLEATKAWLETHEWGQGFSYDRPDTYCVLESAMGALGYDIHLEVANRHRDEGWDDRYHNVSSALEEAAENSGLGGLSGAVTFNDEDGRTKDEVIGLVDKAIEAAS